MSTYQANWNLNGGCFGGHLEDDNLDTLERTVGRIVRGNMSRGDRATVYVWGGEDDRPECITYTRALTGRITREVTR